MEGGIRACLMIGFCTLLRSSVGSICGGCIEIVDDSCLR